MTVHYRCTRRRTKKSSPNYKDCGLRFTKAYQFHEGNVKCPLCNHNAKEDKHVKKQRKEKFKLCYCDGLWFSMKGAPHRKGSKGCDFYEGEYSEEELEKMYRAP